MKSILLKQKYENAAEQPPKKKLKRDVSEVQSKSDNSPDLAQLGYTSGKTNKLSKFIALTTQIIIERHQELIKLLTTTQIVKIAAHKGGSKNIESMTAYASVLKKILSQQIVSLIITNVRDA